MWSIGVITYMLLSGRPPFYGNDDDETLARVRAGKFAFPPAVFDQISAQGKDFISRLLVVDQAARMTARKAQGHPWLHCWDQNPEPLRMDIIGSLRNFHQFSTLKRIAMEVVAFTLRPDQVGWGGCFLLGGDNKPTEHWNVGGVIKPTDRPTLREPTDPIVNDPTSHPRCWSCGRSSRRWT